MRTHSIELSDAELAALQALLAGTKHKELLSKVRQARRDIRDEKSSEEDAWWDRRLSF